MSRIFPNLLQLLRATERNALAPRGGVAFDGSTDTGWVVPLTGQSIGTDPFSVSRVFRVPNSTPSSFSNIVCIGPNTALHTANGSFAVRLGSNAGSVLDIVLTNGSGQNRRLFYDIVGNFGGKVVHLVVVRPTSGEIQVFINGAPVALTLNVGVASAQDSITSSFLFSGRSNQLNSFTDYSASLYNLALSAADVQEIYEMGGAVPERYKWGNQSEYSSDFSVNSNGWNAGDANQTIAANQDGINGADDWLKMESTANATPVYVWPSGSSTPGTAGYAMALIKPGRSVRLKASVFNPAASTLNRAAFYIQSSSVIGGVERTIAASTQYDITEDLTNTGTSTLGRMGVRAGIGSSISQAPTGQFIYVKNLRIIPLGVVAHLPLNDGAGFQLRDDSTNRLHALMTTTGVTHVLPKNGGVFPLRFTTNTNGNQQALGAACIPTNCQIVRVRARTQSGTSTASLGNASGGAQIVSAAALTTSWQILTIVGGAHITSTQNLWVSSNNTNVIEWDIEVEELKA